MTPVDFGLLRELARTQPRHAFRAIAELRRDLATTPEELREAKYNLLLAGRSSDRRAAFLLALYYAGGAYGFDRDHDKALWWWRRLSRYIQSDLEYASDDEYEALRATYAEWTQAWREVCAATGIPGNPSEAPDPSVG